MRAKTVNEYGSMGGYPMGAANDPMAPWNEREDDSSFELEAENNDLNDLSIIRRYNQTAEDEWDEDKGYIDPEDLENFAAEKLGIDIDQKYEDGENLEVQEINDIPGRGQKFNFVTNWGSFETDIDELIDLTNLL